MKRATLFLPLVLASCSSAPPRYDAFPSVVCEKLVGRGWSTLPAAPTNAGSLLRLLNKPHLAAADALWFLRDDGATAVCAYGSDVCGSEAHVFRRSGTDWIVDDSGLPTWICVA
jgi:hypothetical protein